MADLVSILFVGSALMLIVAVVGHGLWLLGANILRTVAGKSTDQQEPANKCPECGRTEGYSNGKCEACGFQVPDASPADLLTARRQIDRLFHLNRINLEQHAALKRAIQDELWRMSTQTPEMPLPPVATSCETVPEANDENRRRNKVAGDTEIVDAELVEEFAEAKNGLPTVGQTPVHSELVHPLDCVDSEPETREQLALRPALANMLQAFLEEKNIRWGELASGILIVGCAIGLIVSLRTTLAHLSQQVPYVPALLFMLGTAAIHGAGLYTLRRWKLRSTSRGVLIIATLLVPLSFAAGIILSGTGPSRVPVTSPIYVLAVFVGIIGYGVITSFSARALFPTNWWPVVVGVMIPSVGQLVINRLATVQSTWPPLILMSGLFALPLLGFLTATLAQLHTISHRSRLTPARAVQTYTILGTATFALIVPLALLLWLRTDWRLIAANLSPMFGVIAAVVTGIGLTIRSRCPTRTMAATSTVGLSLAIFGGMLTAGAVAVAWPQPDILVIVSTVAAITLVLLATYESLPVLLSGAVGIATFGFVVAWHWAAGTLSLALPVTSAQLIAVLVMGRSATIVMIPVVLVGLAAWWLYRRGHKREATAIMAAGAGIEAVSAGIALYAGFYSHVDAVWVTPLFAAYSGTALLAAVLVDLPAKVQQGLAWIGSAFLLAFSIHLLAWNQWSAPWVGQWSVVGAHPFISALLIHGLVVQLIAGAFAVRCYRARGRTNVLSTTSEHLQQLTFPLAASGIASSALALPAVLAVRHAEFAQHAWYGASLAVTWILASLVSRSPALMMFGQAAATFAITMAATAIAQNRFWPEHPFRKLWHWQLQVSVLGIWSVLLTMIRMSVRRVARRGLLSDAVDQHAAASAPPAMTRDLQGLAVAMDHLLSGSWTTVDRVVLSILVPAILVIGAIGCWPGVLVEMGVWPADGAAVAATQWTAIAYEGGSWIALACVLLALVVALGERLHAHLLVGLCVATAALPVLAAGPFMPQQSVASALRWFFAVYLLVWTVLLTVRRYVFAGCDAIWPLRRVEGRANIDGVRNSMLVLGIGPIAALTIWAFLRMQTGHVLGGPSADSWFGQLPTTALYCVPLGLAIVALVVLAVRDRVSDYVFLGALFFHWLVSLVVAIPIATSGRDWTAVDVAYLMQWNGVAACTYGLLALVLRRWTERANDGWQAIYLKTHFVVATIIAAGLAIWTAWELVSTPNCLTATAAALGQWPSLVAITGWMLFASWYSVRRAPGVLPHAILAGLWMLVTVIAATFNFLGTLAFWPNYHQLVVGYLILTALAVLLTWWPTRVRTNERLAVLLRRWGTAIGLLALLWVVVYYFSDPSRPWWNAGVSSALLVLFALFGLRARSQWYAYATLPVASMCVTTVWIAFSRPRLRLEDGLFVNVLAITCVAMFWLLSEVWYQQRENRSFDFRRHIPRVHRVWSVLITMLLFFIVNGVVLLLTFDNSRGTHDNIVATPWAVGAVVAIVALWFASLWDRRSKYAIAGLYACGMIVLAMVLHACQAWHWIDSPTTLAWLAIAGALYVSSTGHLWRWGMNLVRWAERLQVPDPIAELRRTSGWLPTLDLLLTFGVCAWSFVLVIWSPDRSVRVIAAIAPLLATYGVACFAQQRRRLAMQSLTLLLVSLSAVYIGWASGSAPHSHLVLLHHTVQLVIVMTASTVVYGAILVRFFAASSPWYEATRKTAIVTAMLAGVAMAIALANEFIAFEPGRGVPLDTSLVVAISVMLGALVLALLSMALLPDRDPLGLSPTGREMYVYAAQVIAGLLFAHIYLTKPHLFDAGLRPYWPYLVMLLAFASVAVGEMCQRFGWTIIANPLRRSGGFLPLIPALGIWIFSSQSNHALVLFFVGLLYIMLAVVRRSYLAGFLGAVAGNGAIWTLLHDTGFSIFMQPQFWLIPPALSALVAAQLNRDRLTEAQLTAVRYICVIIIYLSSSGEMFMRMLAPVESSQWLRPIILASLAVAGIFAGILLRIRAFLYLGTSFLLLSVIAMVWNAARLVEHTWPWWAFGITLGLLILVMFGVFEKHRRTAQQLIQRLRQWEP